jgi:electron transfer flavoprotein alpha subunit
MWAAGLLAILAAVATALRYYVDRRVSDLAAASRAMEQQQRDVRQAEREAELRGQLQATQLKLQDSTKKVTALEEQARPRVLTASQHDQLVTFLRDKPKGRVVIKASVTAPDARAYAEELRAVLAQEGWTVRIDNAILAGPNAGGVWITVKEPNSAPKTAGLLQNVLKAVGIDARGQHDPDMDTTDNEFWLSVGNR